MENKNKKEGCKSCQVSENTLQALERSGKEKYLSQKELKEKERFNRARNKKIKKAAVITLSLVLLGGLAFVGAKTVNVEPITDGPEITVFYSSDCSCCVEYIKYLKRNGFNVSEDLDMTRRIDILEKHQIPHNMTSCHTSIVGDYFVEGHIPAEVINQLLEEKPEIEGIALPGMPQGSPGMPGLKIDKWTIYSFSEGEYSEYMVY